MPGITLYKHQSKKETDLYEIYVERDQSILIDTRVC